MVAISGVRRATPKKLTERLETWNHPVNEDSPAMHDGRSSRPPLPREFEWIAFTAAVNNSLHTNYKMHELKQLPSDELTKLYVWVTVNG